uniref:Inner mitochondrial membrane peptidase subunit 1 n=3 Tax=Telluraves TaxID=3073808 RepID=A0A8C8AUP3_9STRI
AGAPARTAVLLLTRGRGGAQGGKRILRCPFLFLPPLRFLPPIPGAVGRKEKPAGAAAGPWKVNDRQGLAKERAAGRQGEGRGGGLGSSRVPVPAPHQPSTQSREGSPLESSSCPCRTEGRVPATAARRLPAAAFRWKLVAPRPRAAPPAAEAAAISAGCRLTAARGRREESSPFLSTNGRAAGDTNCPMGGRVVCTSRATRAGQGLRCPVASRQVPKGHVWLEGDNLRNSTDSRCYGPVPYGLIRGRICFKIWPLNDFGFLRASPNGHRFLDD